MHDWLPKYVDGSSDLHQFSPTRNNNNHSNLIISTLLYGLYWHNWDQKSTDFIKQNYTKVLIIYYTVFSCLRRSFTPQNWGLLGKDR